MNKRVIKDGPQLTGAQALDNILLKLEWMMESIDPTGFGYFAGKYEAFAYIKDYVSIIRSEKFDDPKTEDPIKFLAESKSFAL